VLFGVRGAFIGLAAWCYFNLPCVVLALVGRWLSIPCGSEGRRVFVRGLVGGGFFRFTNMGVSGVVALESSLSLVSLAFFRLLLLAMLRISW